MKKNLILMSALFAGSMFMNDGFGANLGGDITNVDELTTHGELSNIDNSDLLNTTYNIEGNRDFKFKNRLYLRIFIRTYHKYIKTMDLLTPDRLSNINTFSLIVTADNIKNGSALNMQKETQELILNKIFTALTDRDFKFESCDDLTTFISAYCDNTTAMGLITSDKLSNIPTEQLEISAEVLNKCLKCLPYYATPSKKANIQRVIDIIDQKLHPIFFAIKSPIKYLFSFF